MSGRSFPARTLAAITNESNENKWIDQRSMISIHRSIRIFITQVEVYNEVECVRIDFSRNKVTYW